jgi:hypothetical protein
MKPARLGTIVLIFIFLLSIVSCDRFNDGSNVVKPTKVVDVPSMAGKSLLEMTKMLGQAAPTASCFLWEFPEGKLTVCYEIGDYAKKWMSSITYELKPDLAAGSLEEMMALLDIDVQGKQAEKHWKGFFTYKDISVNGKSCFIDIHPRGKNFIFGSGNPQYTSAEVFIQNPTIHLYSTANPNERGTTFYEQQTNVNLTVKSVTLGRGNWEVCTEANFGGKCKILDGIDREYLENSKNFSAFGIGETIKSLRPVEIRRNPNL